MLKICMCMCLCDTLVSHAKTAEPIEMPSGEAYLHSARYWRCTLAPPSEYDGLIFAAAAMLSVATITVETPNFLFWIFLLSFWCATELFCSLGEFLCNVFAAGVAISGWSLRREVHSVTQSLNHWRRWKDSDECCCRYGHQKGCASYLFKCLKSFSVVLKSLTCVPQLTFPKLVWLNL